MANIGFAVIFVLGLMFNLLAMPRFGMQWDEAVQQHLARASLSFAKSETSQIQLLRDDLTFNCTANAKYLMYFISMKFISMAKTIPLLQSTGWDWTCYMFLN